MGTLPEGFSLVCSLCWIITDRAPQNWTGLATAASNAIREENVAELFSFTKHSFSHASSPHLLNILLLHCYAAWLLLILHGCCLNRFSKLLFSQDYLCSLGWHLLYKSSRLHHCCCSLNLGNNFTVRICFFFSTGCLTVMHEEAPVSKCCPPLSPDTAIASSCVTAYRRSHWSWGFCSNHHSFSLTLL